VTQKVQAYLDTSCVKARQSAFIL